ncbi:MAG: phasin family protein [Acidobacteria bacterium]|nr:phasin family protein [Acidobacteriota bacterium]
MAKKKSKASKAQEEVLKTANNIWLAGLGALATAEEEGSKLFRKLVEKGEKLETEGRERLGKVREEVEERVDVAKERAGEARERVESAFGDLAAGVDERVNSALQRLGVPTRDEIRRLSDRVADLTAKVEGMKPAASKPAATKPKTTRKPAKAAGVRSDEDDKTPRAAKTTSKTSKTTGV